MRQRFTTRRGEVQVGVLPDSFYQQWDFSIRLPTKASLGPIPHFFCNVQRRGHQSPLRLQGSQSPQFL